MFLLLHHDSMLQTHGREEKHGVGAGLGWVWRGSDGSGRGTHKGHLRKAELAVSIQEQLNSY